MAVRGAATRTAQLQRPKPAPASHKPAAHGLTVPKTAHMPRRNAEQLPSRDVPLAAPAFEITGSAALATPSEVSGPADWRRVAAKVSQSAKAPFESTPFDPSGKGWSDCSSVYVYIVTLDIESPHKSAASLALSKTEPGRWRQPGQSLGAWKVVAIVDDWSGLNPTVWLRKGEEVCRAELEGNATRRVQKEPPRRKRARSRRR